MTRLERILDGQGSAEDALLLIRGPLQKHRVPHAEDVQMCASRLRLAAATLEGALTLPMEAEGAAAGKMPALPEAPPGEDLWFRKGSMA